MADGEGMILGLIVEGQGEVTAAPTLIRHIARDLSIYAQLRFKVCRVPRSELIQAGELERAVEALTRQIGRNQPLLILLDADDDCPRDLAERLTLRCRTRHADVRVSVVIANCEYEAWFLAAAKSLAGKSGAKEWLSQHETRAKLLANKAPIFVLRVDGSG